MSIGISQIKDHYISVYQDRYYTYIVYKYVDTATVKTSKNIYNTNLPYDMIFTKADAYTSAEQVDNFTRELNINYRACIGSLICLLYTKSRFEFCSTQFRKNFIKSC